MGSVVLIAAKSRSSPPPGYGEVELFALERGFKDGNQDAPGMAGISGQVPGPLRADIQQRAVIHGPDAEQFGDDQRIRNWGHAPSIQHPPPPEETPPKSTSISNVRIF